MEMVIRGVEVKIDEDDSHWVLCWSYHVLRSKKAKTIYVQRSDGKLLHRLLMGLELGDRRQVDHINGDGLDNRRENLRIVTQAQNQANRGRNRNNKSGLKGVYWNKTKGAWQTSIQMGGRKNNKSIYLGRYATKEQAYEAYKEGARKYQGEFARFE